MKAVEFNEINELQFYQFKTERLDIRMLSMKRKIHLCIRDLVDIRGIGMFSRPATTVRLFSVFMANKDSYLMITYM